MKSRPGPPMTSGNAATARVWLIVWCKTFGHQVEPDLAEMAASYGANTSVLDWPDRPIRSGCGGRNVDMVVTGPNGDSFESRGARHPSLNLTPRLSCVVRRGACPLAPRPASAWRSTGRPFFGCRRSRRRRFQRRTRQLRPNGAQHPDPG